MWNFTFVYTFKRTRNYYCYEITQNIVLIAKRLASDALALVLKDPCKYNKEGQDSGAGKTYPSVPARLPHTMSSLLKVEMSNTLGQMQSKSIKCFFLFFEREVNIIYIYILLKGK